MQYMNTVVPVEMAGSGAEDVAGYYPAYRWVYDGGLPGLGYLVRILNPGSCLLKWHSAHCMTKD